MPTTSHIERRRWLALALLCSAFFMVILDVAIVNVALPSIQADLGFSQRNLQWVVSAYALTFGGLLLLGGRTADLLGRRRVFIGGVAVFALASLLGGLAWQPELLVAARALQGIGAAMMTPAALSILMTTFPEGAERNKALGAWGAVGASGGTIGLLIGGILTQTVGWEWIFLLNVPVGAAVIALSPVLLQDTRDLGLTHRLDLAGAITVTAALSLLVYGIVDADRAGWRSVQTIGIAAGSAVLLAAFGVIERRSPAPLLPFHIFRLRALPASNVAGLLFGGAVFGMFFIITLYLQQVLGYSPLHAGLAWLALSVTALLASVGGAQLVTRIGPFGPLVGGLAIAALGIWLLSRLPAEAAYLSDVMLPLIVSGAGIGLAFVTMSIGALEGIGDRDAGLASGLVNTTQQIGGALGVALLSTVALDRFKAAPLATSRASTEFLTGAFGDALVVGAGLAGTGALVAAVLLRARPAAIEQPSVYPAPTAPRFPLDGDPAPGRTRTGRRWTMKRILVLLTVTATAAFATVAAAQAQTVSNTTVSYAYSGWVPCANGGAGELVNGVIDVHILETATTKDNVDAWKFEFAPRGSLVGTVTGDTYRLGGVEHGTYVETQSGRYAATYIHRYHLIGPGGGNNLVVRETAHLTLDGDDVIVDRDELDIECS